MALVRRNPVRCWCVQVARGMRNRRLVGAWLTLMLGCVAGTPVAAQQVLASLPPADSPPLFRNIELRFDAQGGASGIDANTYVYYMKVAGYVSDSTQGRWTPYDETIEQILLEDFRSLWETGFLDDLSISVVDDEPYDNGVLAKRVIFQMEERERVKIVTFEGSDELDRADIDDAMNETGLAIRLDSFLDLSKVRQAEGLLRAMFSGKGYQFAEVSHELTAVAGGPKVVQLTFHLDEGPKVHIEEIEFIGNEELNDGELKGQMKEIRERWWLSFISGRGTYKEALFEADADRVVAHYMEEGFIDAKVGSPDAQYLDVSEDGKSRGMRLRIPVDEGPRYRVGDLRFDGNEVVAEFGLRSMFAGLVPGEYYSQKIVSDAIELANQFYGRLGYTGLTMFPDLQRRTSPDYSVSGGIEPDGDSEGVENPYADLQKPTHLDGAPIVDVTIRIQEGEQQFVKRITFTGNSSTRDEVIRRELQLVENGVFNTAALQTSIRRLNQLGYFEPFEESSVDIETVEGSDNEVNLTMNLVEANLNQLTFGAGVSQFDGFFGQLSFSTSNFLGRGETLSVGVQNGSRLRDINLGYTKPYLFGKNMSGGVNVFSRRIEWIGAYTQETTGASVTVGWPLALFTRMFVSYGYEVTGVSDINPFFTEQQNSSFLSPFLADALLIGTNGRRTIGRVTPSVRFDTVDHPIFPNVGSRYSASLGIAGVGGNTKFLKPVLEGAWYIPHLSRTTIGIRTQYQFIASASPQTIPVFERLWLGGEFSVRGFDIRRIGPTVADLNPEVPQDSFQGRTVMGGNKSLLLNLEYQIRIAQPVRFIFFYDTGQVQDFGDRFAMNDFKTSTGLELRIFMPMLNVPFRLIYSWNPQRDGVYNDNFQQQEVTTFRFAVGTTF